VLPQSKSLVRRCLSLPRGQSTLCTDSLHSEKAQSAILSITGRITQSGDLQHFGFIMPQCEKRLSPVVFRGCKTHRTVEAFAIASEIGAMDTQSDIADTLRLIRAFRKIRDRNVRLRIIAMVEAAAPLPDTTIVDAGPASQTDDRETKPWP
jgi:hypothetical protein